MIIQIGIDEAGRGCAIGPMVMAAVAIYPGQELLLEHWNVRDSKKTPDFTRAMLRRQIMQHLSYVTRVVPTTSVDYHVKQGKLNEVTRKIASELIHDMCETHISNDFTTMEVNLDGKNIFDTLQPTGDLLSWSDRLVFNVEDHADDKYRVVSAASILAKTLRDEICMEIMGKNFHPGSGYCNEYTANWLRTEFQDRWRAGFTTEEILQKLQVRKSFKWTKELLKEINKI